MDSPLPAFSIISGLLGSQSAVSSFSIALLFATLTYAYFYYKNLSGYFARLGLKSPPFYPIVGNLLTIILSDRYRLPREWAKKYGKLYGVFYGNHPKFVVADAEVLRQVCIKDFDAMPNHDRDDLLEEYQKHFIFFLQDDHWKRVRALQSPTFTSGRIKRMFKLLNKCCDDLVQCFEDKLTRLARGDGDGDRTPARANGVLVNLKDTYMLYTLDCIASVSWSMKLKRGDATSIKGVAGQDEFLQLALEIFNPDSVRFVIALSLPTWLARLTGFKLTSAGKTNAAAAKVRQMINSRRRSGKKFDDYLQVLIDASPDDRLELDELDEKENHHAALTRDMLLADQASMLEDIRRRLADNKRNGESGSRSGESSSPAKEVERADYVAPITQRAHADDVKMSDQEIIAGAMFLLIVGLETSSTLLTNCTYALAFHPDIQERLYQTILALAKCFNNDPTHSSTQCSFDYESLTASPYLDAVVSETLRALSPVTELDRRVSRDCLIEKYNLTLKEGDKLLLSYHAIMNDPEYFPEPLRFDPDRFMPENRDKIVPGSYCPFGLGPRHCIGMRFALTETKLALARVLMRYKFIPAPGTVYPPDTTKTFELSCIANPIVEMQLRDELMSS